MSNHEINVAKDPNQYDSGAFDFEKWGSLSDPTRMFIADALQSKIGDLRGKRVLDIGSGQGSFFRLWLDLGAREIVGIEPSKKNIEISEKHFPNISVFNGTLEQFQSIGKFDTVMAIMVFEHLEDIEGALRKIKDLLAPTGQIYLVSMALEYTLSPDYYYKMETENLKDGSVIATIHRPEGVLRDFLRPVHVFLDAAESAGFRNIEHIPLLPTDTLCNDAPRYAQYRKVPVRQLFILGF